MNVGNNHIYWTNGILSHNSFLGSVATLISGKKIAEFKEHFDDLLNVDKDNYNAISIINNSVDDEMLKVVFSNLIK